MKLTNILTTICAIALLAGATSCTSRQNEDPKAKYIFYFIGDGMGYGHISATESYLSYKAGKLGGESLLFTQFPVLGMASTYSASNIITCSAAAGTALATGYKTNAGHIGVNPDWQPLKSICYDLQEEGYNIGILSSVPLNHATPAAFYAHNKDRNAYYEITSEIPATEFEYFAGSGILGYFGKDGKQRSSAEFLEENGYDVCFGREELAQAAPDSKVVLCQPYNRDREPDNYDVSRVVPDEHISLAEMLQYGIDRVGDSEPFFFMCEGGEIDWAGHDDRTMPMVKATMAFDDAVAVAYDFYLKHPDETLIIITADHETGGIAIGGIGSKYHVNWEHIDTTWTQLTKNPNAEENKKLNDEALIGWTCRSHTGGHVPVFAIGKGSERFMGKMDNTEIKGRILGE